MPTIVNVVVLLTLFFVASSYLDSWVDVVMSWFPDWMSLFYWLVWLIALMVVLRHNHLLYVHCKYCFFSLQCAPRS